MATMIISRAQGAYADRIAPPIGGLRFANPTCNAIPQDVPHQPRDGGHDEDQGTVTHH
jgi:hypothetical protein